MLPLTVFRGQLPEGTNVTPRTQALTTLLQAGFTAEQLGEENLKTLGDFLDGELRTNGGVTGFGELLASFKNALDQRHAEL